MTKKQSNQKALLLEAFRIGYRLRSTFFYRKLNEYHTHEFPETIKRLIPLSKSYEWEKYKEWGISDKAINQIKESPLSLIQVFSHPRLIREHPQLVAYYRNVAALSQKSVSYLVNIHVNKFEGEEPSDMEEKESQELSNLFNQHISLIIESAIEGFDEKDVTGLLFASTGAQIDGSWRNAIGDEAEKIVQKLLITEAIDRKLLTTFILKDASVGVEKFDIANSSKQLERSIEFRGFTLKNSKSIIFSSEPDISLLDKDGKTISVIEVKGGTDPAGALERYGAAKKSFEASLKDNPKSMTILLASCITEEVDKRIKSDKTIARYYNLTALLINNKEKKMFLSLLFDELLK